MNGRLLAARVAAARPWATACVALALVVAAAPAVAQAAVSPTTAPATTSPSPSGAGPATLPPLSGTLNGTPFEDFGARDTRDFLEAARGALVAPLGATRRWANDASGAWGLLGATRDFRRGDSACREIRGEHVIARRVERFRLVACRTTKGEWRVASSGPARGPAQARPAAQARPPQARPAAARPDPQAVPAVPGPSPAPPAPPATVTSPLQNRAPIPQ